MHRLEFFALSLVLLLVLFVFTLPLLRLLT
jgi:hypothetical protein